MQTLLNSPNVTTKTGLRDKLLLYLLYTCGLRVSECCLIKLNDIKTEHIEVLGKGNKTRIVPITATTKMLIELYLKTVTPTKFVFNSYKNSAISRQRVFQIIKKYTKLVFKTDSISPHWLRHSFATHLLDQQASVRDVQQLLGHQNIDTTQIYTHVSRKKIKAVFDQYHPGNT